MKIKTSKGDRTFQVINILIFAIFAIICAYPFYYLIDQCKRSECKW